ncbi:MAG: histidinol-phosphate transaminase [Gemmatimonadaceae bacterium]
MTTQTTWSPRAELRDIRAYTVDPTPCALELADNTSQFGVPPAALRAITAAVTDRLARYPTTYSRELREAIASYVGVRPDEVMVGCGSDELLGCAFRALGNPGDRVAYMDPTFVMARVFAQTNSLQPVAVPLTSRFDADADALLAVAAPITYVCTPNNPTGGVISPNALDRVLTDATGLVFLDEAYAEYAGTNIAGQAPAHERMLAFRTFSKVFGLAGARVGFVVGSRPLIAELEKVRGPFTVSALSECAALAAVRDDLEWVRNCVSQVREARDMFSNSLTMSGFAPLHSDANFVLVPVIDAPAWGSALRARGIHVRQFAALPVVGDALRITIASSGVMTDVARAMIDVRNELEARINA